MKKCIIKVFILLIVPILLSARIVEMSSFSDIIQYAEGSQIWVVTDLDNTLMESTRHLGSTQWGEYLVKKLLTEGQAKNYAEAMLAIDPIWRKIQAYITVRPVERSIPTVIKQLQDRGVVVLGLTSRLPEDALFTRDQLHSIYINLATNTLIDDALEWQLEDRATYEEGILYSSYKNYKSEVLHLFLKSISHQPKRIVFVDDKMSHVNDLERAFSGSSIELIGVRYGGADARVRAFDPIIAEIQLNTLPKILSDEEAAVLLLQK